MPLCMRLAWGHARPVGEQSRTRRGRQNSRKKTTARGRQTTRQKRTAVTSCPRDDCEILRNTAELSPSSSHVGRLQRPRADHDPWTVFGRATLATFPSLATLSRVSTCALCGFHCTMHCHLLPLLSWCLGRAFFFVICCVLILSPWLRWLPSFRLRHVSYPSASGKPKRCFCAPVGSAVPRFYLGLVSSAVLFTRHSNER